MDYKQEMKSINELITKRKEINSKISKNKDAMIDAIYISLQKKLPTDIDIDDDISICVNDISIDICICGDDCRVSTKAISVLEDILGEGEISYFDNELIVNFKY